MRSLRRLVAPLLLWAAVVGALALVAAVATHGPELVRRLATAADDPRPGCRITPTPEQVRATQELWRKRKME